MQRARSTHDVLRFGELRIDKTEQILVKANVEVSSQIFESDRQVWQVRMGWNFHEGGELAAADWGASD